MNVKKIFKWFAIGVGVLIGSLIIVIIAAILISTFHTNQNKKHLENAYNKISLPSSMTLSDSVWIGGNIDTADYLGYTYTTNNQGQSLQDFQTAVQQAGYTVKPPVSNNLLGDYIATNNSEDTRLRFQSKNQSLIDVQVFRASINRDTP
jgi:hypothetical protein